MSSNNFRDIVEKIKKALLKKPELFILVFYSMLIVFLTGRIPTNPDEYLYASIGNNFAEAFRGNVCFGCIDTYHTFLLSIIIGFFNFLTGIDSFFIYRLIASIFSIGFIFLACRLFKEIFKRPTRYVSVLLLMFPGFFYFGSMILLDGISLFFFTILVYLIVKKRNYWQIGAALVLLFLSKEYYIIFGVPVVLAAVIYDSFFSNREMELSSRYKFFLKSLAASFLFTFVAISGMVTFIGVPYPRFIEDSMMEIFGSLYRYGGTIIGSLIYGNNPNSEIIGPINFIGDLVFKDAKSVISDSGFVAYFKNTFNEVYLNLYTLPLAIYGIFLYFFKKHGIDRRVGIVMMSIVVSFLLFFAGTSELGLNGFRFAFVLIIPFIFFIALSLEDFVDMEKIKPRHYAFIFISSVYMLIWLIGIQGMDSGSAVYKSDLAQFFLRYKLIFNIFFYAFPLVVMISKFRLGAKKTLLISWVALAFVYKLGPEIVNSYMIEKRSDVDYNLTLASGELAEIEAKDPTVLTNYERAYYYYSKSVAMPNNIQEDLPVIRPKPRKIYEDRVAKFDDNGVSEINENSLCRGGIEYIVYVNRDYLPESYDFGKIPGIIIAKEFSKGGNLNWGIYKFDRRVCR